jgi:hypothetical protein
MNRRECIGLAGALALPIGNLSSVEAAPDLFADKLLTHVRIRGREDGKPVFFWYQGTFYGQRSGERTVPLLRIEGASSSRTERQADGSWIYSLREAGWFSDLATHEVLHEWTNPLNGRVVQPAHYNSSQRTRFAADGVHPIVSKFPPGMEYTGYLGDPVVQGDDVWTTEELFVRVPSATAGAPATLQTSLATLSASRAELLQPPDGYVGALLAYQTLASWRPWMEMGADPGVISWRLAGRKCATAEGIPAALLARTRREHPDALEI